MEGRGREESEAHGVSPEEVSTAVVANPVKRNGVATGYHTPSTPELKPLADAHIEVVAACHAMSSHSPPEANQILDQAARDEFFAEYHGSWTGTRAS